VYFTHTKWKRTDSSNPYRRRIRTHESNPYRRTIPSIEEESVQINHTQTEEELKPFSLFIYLKRWV
jgi:hypothetical protein